MSGAQLPPDIIFEIFQAAAEIDPPMVASNKNQDGSLGWISLTHVCNLWRQIGLNSPTLWAGIPFSLPSAFETILQRAGEAPLTVDIDKFESIRLSEILLRHPDLLSRASNINDSGIGTGLRRTVWGTVLDLPQRLPHLRSLRLMERTASMLISNRGIEVPSLRSCELLLEHFPFTSAPQLTTLKLRDVYGRLAHPSWRPLLGIMFACPALERLYVDLSVRRQSTKINQPQSVLALPADGMAVQLPHMTFMKIELRVGSREPYPSSHLCALLQRIEIPTSASVSIGCKAVEDSPYPLFMSALTPQLELSGRDALVIAVSQSDKMYYEDIHGRARHSYNMVSATVCSSPGTPSPSFTEERGVTFLVDYDLSPQSMPQLLASLAHAVAPSLRTLMVRDEASSAALARSVTGGEQESWRELGVTESDLREFVHISTVYLRTWRIDALELLRAGEGRGLFPDLGTVVVDHALEMENGTAAGWWTGLAAALAMRRRAGRPVYDLILRGDRCKFMDPMQDFHVLHLIDERTEQICTCKAIDSGRTRQRRVRVVSVQ